MSKKRIIDELKYVIDKKCEYELISGFIKSNINELTYEEVLTQKILLKLYINKQLSEDQKNNIVDMLCSNFISCKKDLNNNWLFLKTFYPFMEEILEDIKNNIIVYFDNSLFTFLYCLGMYINENPNIILLAKNVIVYLASCVLVDDMSTNMEIKSKIQVAEDTYYKRKDIIVYIYNKAIEYGTFYEQYDDVCYMISKVENVDSENNKPVARIKVYNDEYIQSIKLGSLYDEILFYNKKENESGDIQKYYIDKINNHYNLLKKEEFTKEIALALLERQFKNIKTLDLLYLYSGEIQSYIFSMISFFYTELILLILTTNKSYVLIDKRDLREKMLFGHNISLEDFEMCISLVCSKKKNMKNLNETIIPFFQLNNKIIIGRWMFWADFLIMESTKKITLNCNEHKKLGQNTEHFGKTVLENLIKSRFKSLGWEVVQKGIKIKRNKNIDTDIDLVAFKNGQVLIGQIKYANCGRSNYDLWKAGKIIKRAIEQSLTSMEAVKKDDNLLYSILKKEKIIKNRDEIKEVIYIVITSSNFFNKIGKKCNVSVIGLESLDEWLVKIYSGYENVKINDFLDSPFKMHKLDKQINKIESIINTEKFKIVYEEFE